MTSPAPHPETIQKLGSAAFPAFAMVAGMQLDLFTPLGARPMDAEQLAGVLGVEPAKLAPLLYALVAAGLLTVEDGLFANTPEADCFLVRGKPTYFGERHAFYTARYQELLQTAASIRTGRPQAKLDFASMSAEALEKYLKGLHPGTMATGRALVKRLDLSSHRHLLDVGGGSGGLALALAKACPELRVTVLELPSVTPVTRRFIEQEGMAERADVVAEDVVRGPLTGVYDGAVLRAFLQVLSPDDAKRTLQNLIKVLAPGSPIYILGQVLDDSRLAPPETVAFNLVFLNVYDEGQAYAEHEYRGWLTEAGFTGIERVLLAGGESLVTARKPA
ncbi:MAG: methyltransferase [Humidesulfovibrio sp.]|nr:methyltransferase [Humidesulfovibrio sp.]